MVVKAALIPIYKVLWVIYVFFLNFILDNFQKQQRKPTKIQTLR